MFVIKIFILFFLFHEICCGSYDIVFNQFDKMPETDPTFLNFGTLRISKKSRKVVEFSGEFYLHHKLTNVGIVTLTVFRLNKMGLPPLQVFLTSGGFCDLVGNDQYLYPNILAHSDLPEEYCPLQPGNYTFKDLIIHMSKFPQAIPLGDYMGKMTYSLNNVIKFGYIITASIIAADDQD